MLRSALLLVLVPLLAVACGGADGAGQPTGATGEPTEGIPGAGADPTSGAVADSSRLTGALGGDATLEGGCAWLDAGDERYEVLWPEGYEVAFDPLRLLGPEGEEVAAEGDEVTVEGTPAEEMVSVCQVGALFRADQVVDPG